MFDDAAEVDQLEERPVPAAPRPGYCSPPRGHDARFANAAATFATAAISRGAVGAIAVGWARAADRWSPWPGARSPHVQPSQT